MTFGIVSNQLQLQPAPVRPYTFPTRLLEARTEPTRPPGELWGAEVRSKSEGKMECYGINILQIGVQSKTRPYPLSENIKFSFITFCVMLRHLGFIYYVACIDLVEPLNGYSNTPPGTELLHSHGIETNTKTYLRVRRVLWHLPHEYFQRPSKTFLMTCSQ